MEYFLELTTKEEQFVVHHSKLVEYGIMTSTESSKVKDKLNSLSLIKNVDYRVADVREPFSKVDLLNLNIIILLQNLLKSV